MVQWIIPKLLVMATTWAERTPLFAQRREVVAGDWLGTSPASPPSKWHKGDINKVTTRSCSEGGLVTKSGCAILGLVWIHNLKIAVPFTTAITSRVFWRFWPNSSKCAGSLPQSPTRRNQGTASMIDPTEGDLDNLYSQLHSLFSTDGLGLVGTQFLGCPRSPSIGSSPSVAVPVPAAAGVSQGFSLNQRSEWTSWLKTLLNLTQLFVCLICLTMSNITGAQICLNPLPSAFCAWVQWNQEQTTNGCGPIFGHLQPKLTSNSNCTCLDRRGKPIWKGTTPGLPDAKSIQPNIQHH